MKIDSIIKSGELSQEHKKHLQFIDTMNVKSSLVIIILLLFDLPITIGLASTMNWFFLWILAPLIVIIHLWTIRLLIKNPYSTQFEVIRYTGVLGIVGAFSFLLLSQGMAYISLYISSSLFYMIVNITFLIMSYILIKYQIIRYSENQRKEQQKSDQSKYIGLMIISPAIGLILFQLTKDTSLLQLTIMVALIYLLSLFYVYVAAKFIHKYLFMKVNIDYVTFQTPIKKEYKKFKEKGIEIK